MRFPEYSNMKDSGMEWLGEIPEHWEMCALRRKLEGGNEGIKIGPFGSQLKLEVTIESGYKVYGQEHIIGRDFSLGSKYVGEKKYLELQPCEVKPNDILVTMMGTSGRCQIVPNNIEKGIMDSHLLRLRVKKLELDPLYVVSLIDEADYIRKQLETSGKGSIMHGLNSSIIKSIIIAIPPVSEQKIIIRFLNQKTSKIDSLISKKEQLIQLLQEKRIAIISHAVTKGLDPNVKMNDADVEWLGQIPEHWEVKRLKYISRLNYGDSLSEENRELGDIPVYGSNGVVGHHCRSNAYSPSIIVGRKGSYGKLNYCESSCFAIDTTYFIDSTVTTTHIRWLFYLLQTIKLDSFSEDSAVPGLSRNFVYEKWVPFTSFNEQKEIALFLDHETSKIDILISKVREALEKLTEYRTALISAAVTGKIDVRKEIH